jgi:hypothetical protein
MIIRDMGFSKCFGYKNNIETMMAANMITMWKQEFTMIHIVRSSKTEWTLLIIAG